MMFAGCSASAAANYLNWTHEDWVTADEGDRLNCTEAYAKAVLTADGSAADETEIQQNTKAFSSVLEAGLNANPGATVQDMADMAVAAACPGTNGTH